MPDGIHAMYLNLNNEWKPLPKKLTHADIDKLEY